MGALRAHVANDFEYEDINKHYGITTDKLLEWLDIFKQYDRGKSGFISQAEFAAAMAKTSNLAMNDPRTRRSLFSLFDTEQSGHMSYRECIQALAMLNYEKDPSGRNKVCFKLCGPDQDGIIARPKLQALLEDCWVGELHSLTHLLKSCPDKVDFDTFSRLADSNGEVAMSV